MISRLVARTFVTPAVHYAKEEASKRCITLKTHDRHSKSRVGWTPEKASDRALRTLTSFRRSRPCDRLTAFRSRSLLQAWRFLPGVCICTPLVRAPKHRSRDLPYRHILASFFICVVDDNGQREIFATNVLGLVFGPRFLASRVPIAGRKVNTGLRL